MSLQARTKTVQHHITSIVHNDDMMTNSFQLRRFLQLAFVITLGDIPTFTSLVYVIPSFVYIYKI